MAGQPDAAVRDIMSRSLVTVNPATTALQIAKMMEQGGIGAVLVRDGKSHVGIVTDRDFATRVAAGGMPLDSPAEGIMSSPLVTIGQDETVRDAARMMTQKRIRKLAVTGGDGIVGLVTSTDIVGALAG